MFPPFEDGREFKSFSTNHVGALYELNAKTEEARGELCSLINISSSKRLIDYLLVRDIFADQELVIGRNPKKWCVTRFCMTTCMHEEAANPIQSGLVIDDPLVSNKHFRIYTIIFDQVDPEVDPRVAPEVAPLVYAQDLSLNGVHWNGYRMGKEKGGYLLNDGDVLQVAHGISFQFRCDRATGSHFCDTQAEEMEASESTTIELVHC